MKDGGFAFPRPLPPGTIATPEVAAKHGGLTVRQWFAGMALAGLIADSSHDAAADGYVTVAYAIADAMIAAGEE